jgi:hypothetical protein
MTERELSMYIQRLDCHIGKAWFKCSWTQAVAIFVSVLVGPDAQVESRVESAWVDSSRVEPLTAMATVVGDPTESTEAEYEGSDSTSMLDDPIWGFGSPCSTREASKSAVIRSDLILRLGKDSATQLLAKAKATVARDRDGKKNRVLRLGGRFLKVKPP